MKKIILYFLAALLILAPVESFARTRLLTSAPVYKGAITDLRVSAVDGTAFIDNAGATIPTFADGNHSIEIYDSSNRMLKGVLKAAGSSETLGANPAFLASLDLTTGWTPVYSTINDANTFTTIAAGGVTRSSVLTVNALYYGDMEGSTTSTNISLRNSTSTTNFGDMSALPSYRTIIGDTALYIRNYDAGVSDITSISIQQVLTPSALGATIVSAKAGETYNFSYKNPSFTYNAASYYVVIKKIVGEVVVASGDITAGNALIDSTTANAFAAPVGVDLTAYQTGKYRLDLYSTASGVLWAQGFISATAPSGEALSDEIITDTTFDNDGSWTIKQSTWTVSGGKANASNTTGHLGQTSINRAFQLFKVILVCDSYTSGSYGPSIDGATKPSLVQTGTGTKTLYRNSEQWSGTSYGVYGSSLTATFTDISIKQVTMPAATGALLLSSYGGSRGFVFKHASFDPNAALSYKIVKVID